jgi:hypothetical protein
MGELHQISVPNLTPAIWLRRPVVEGYSAGTGNFHALDWDEA